MPISLLSPSRASHISVAGNSGTPASAGGHGEPSGSVTRGTDTGADAPEESKGPVIGSIRFVPHIEYTARQTLNFEPMERKAHDSAHLRVGRHNDKSQNRTSISFKSKVVSRSHAEVWCDAGTWYIKDVKSSSGTFLNHIRLSPPGVESQPTRLNDGDCIQFGIDFRGGAEEVYRCVRTRLEINRVFQQGAEVFNQQAHRHLKALTTPAAGPGASGALDKADAASVYSAECCICLFSIAPAQALFVAPCSHTYHFKCIRPLILQTYPAFMCCVCRKYADLEASVEVENASWVNAQRNGQDPRTPMAEIEEPPYASFDQALGTADPSGTAAASNGASAGVPGALSTNTVATGMTLVGNTNDDEELARRAANLGTAPQADSTTSAAASSHAAATAAALAIEEDDALARTTSHGTLDGSATVGHNSHPVASGSGAGGSARLAIPSRLRSVFGEGGEEDPSLAQNTPRNNSGPFLLDHHGVD